MSQRHHENRLALCDAVLVIPPDGSRNEAAKVIRDAARETHGIDLPVASAAHTAEPQEDRHILALGCMADNPFIERLYLRWRTLVDRWYPGAEGHVLQSLYGIEPSGRNVIIVGGSDPEGVLSAARRLAERIEASENGALEWLLEVKLGREHLPLPADRIDLLGTSMSEVPTPESIPPETAYQSGYSGGSIRDHLLRLGMYGPNAGNSHFSRSSQFGLRYLYTGKIEDAQRYRETLLEEIRLGVVRRLYHYKSIRMFQLWDVLAPSHLFSDEDRRIITDAIQDYLLHGTGVASLETIKQKSTGTGLFDRHTACDALNLWIGSDYFFRHTGAARWLEYRQIANDYFRSFRGVDVPHTGLTEGYYSYLEVYLDWMLLSCPDDVRENPHIALWGERIMGLCSNAGAMVRGPQTLDECYPYNLLRKLAWLLNDGRYLFVADLRERAVRRGQDRVFQFSAGQAYAGDVRPRTPEDMTGLKVFPLNERHRQWVARSIPAGAGFDRAAGRTGWSLTDEYFMVVGVRGGSKVLPNVAALASYERFGERWIASPNMGLYANENAPQGYSGVTVIQQGLGAGPAAAARVIGRWSVADTEIFAFRVSRKGCYDWTRTLWWRPERHLLIVDRVRLMRDGDFTVSVNWRCARRMHVDGSLCHTRCRSAEGKTCDFYIETSRNAELLYEPEPHYRLDDPQSEMESLPVLHAMSDGCRSECDTVEVATLIHATEDPNGPQYRLHGADAGWAVEGPEETVVFRGAVNGASPAISSVSEVSAPPTVVGRRPVTLERRELALRAAWRVPIAGEPAAWSVSKDGHLIAIGTQDGVSVLVDSHGNAQWTGQHESSVTALAFLDHDLIVGTQAGRIERLHPAGTTAWRYQCRFRPERALWPWWFCRTPRVASLGTGLDPTTGRWYVAAGTGSSALNILDAECGELVADPLSPYGLPDIIFPYRIREINELRFFVGHRLLTPDSAVRAWPPPPHEQGPLVYHRTFRGDGGRVEGWDSCGVTAFHVGPLEERGPDRVILLRHGTFNQLSAYDRASADPLWTVELGGRPIALAVSDLDGDGRKEIYVAEQFGWLSSFDAQGRHLAARRVADRLAGLAISRDREIMLWNDRLLRYDNPSVAVSEILPGRPLGWCRTEAAEGLLMTVNEEVWITTVRG